MKATSLIYVVVFTCSSLALGDDTPSVSSATKDDNQFLLHEVESPFQAGKTQIRVLMPDDLDRKQRYSVVYVLPVERLNEHRYGDGLLEIKRHGLHNKHRLIFVAITFSHLPWYADHPTEPTIRQESYFLQLVVPFIDMNYPAVTEPKGRLLLGFSKSGWGAWSLLLRNPDVFGGAAAWDAPMTMDRMGQFGSAEIFGTQETFQKHQVSDLLRKRASDFAREKRLILMGFSGFRKEHEMTHKLLDELKIPHEYRDGPERTHDWHGGWVPQAVEFLVKEGGC